MTSLGDTSWARLTTGETRKEKILREEQVGVSDELVIRRGEDGQLSPNEKKRREISVQNQLRIT